MKILVLNAGSSSLKYQLIDIDTEEVLVKGLCERIGIDGRHTNKTNGNKYVDEVAMPNHTEALRVVMECLESQDPHRVQSTLFPTIGSATSSRAAFGPSSTARR